MITALRTSTLARPTRSSALAVLPKTCRPSVNRQRTVLAFAAENPARQMLSGLASTVYKVTASMQPSDASSTPLWAGLKKLDLAAVQSAIRAGADINERNAQGDTPMLFIAREGHYKYPPAQIPAALVAAGVDLEAKDSKGLTALQVSLLSGWQNIAELLIKSGASTTGVAGIKTRLTCPDCKRIVAKYNL